MLVSSFPSRQILLVVFSFLCLSPQFVNAQTWTGGGADANWETPANWSAFLDTGESTVLTFAGNNVTNNNNLAADSVFGGITFASTASQFTLSGNRITLGGPVVGGNISFSVDPAGPNPTDPNPTSPITQNIGLEMVFDATGTITTQTNGSIQISQEISGAGGLTKLGDGKLILTGIHSYLGPTTIEVGTLQLGDGVSNGLLMNTSSINVSAGADLTFNTSFSDMTQGVDFSTAIISGGGSLTKNGSEFLILTQNHTYSGVTNINEGVLVLGDGVSPGSGSLLNSSSINIESNATLAIFRADDVIQGDSGANGLTSGLITGGGGFAHVGSGRVVLTENNDFSGDTYVMQGTLELGAGGTTGSIIDSSAVVLDPGATLVVNRSNDLIQGGSEGARFTDAAIEGGNLIQRGDGRFVLTSDDNYFDSVTIEKGTLQIGNGENSGVLGSLNNVSVGVNGTLVVDRGSGAGILYQGDVIGSGVNGPVKITGDGAFTKSGDSTFVLTADNDYKGITTVAGGTLVIEGNHTDAIGDIVVNNGATLVVGSTGTINSITNVASGGTFIADGTVLGATTIAGTGTLSGSGTFDSLTTINGIHSPGNSPGMQVFNNGLTYGTGASIEWELFDPTAARGVGYDAIDVMGGNLTFSGLTSLNLSFGPSILWTDAFWNTNQSWRLFLVAGGPGSILSPGNFTLNTIGLDSAGDSLNSKRAGASFSLLQDDDGFIIRFDNGSSAVPEPGSLALMSVVGLFGGGRLVQRYIRRRKKTEASTC